MMVLDIKVSLYNASQQLITILDPANKMSVNIDTTLNTGTYYLIVDGTGNANTSNYGSLGSYRLSSIAGPLAIHSVTLTGSTFKDKHNLNWSVVADEAIKTQEVQFSEDGMDFKSLAIVDPVATAFSYAPYRATILYYRIKVTSVLNQTMYSNVIALRVNWRPNLFTISTFVNRSISVTASEDYQYRLWDAGGRLIATGNGIKGFNTINIDNRSAGYT